MKGANYLIILIITGITLINLAGAAWTPPCTSSTVCSWSNLSLNNLQSHSFNAYTSYPILLNTLNFSAYLDGGANSISIYNGFTQNSYYTWIEGNTYVNAGNPTPNVLQAYTLNTVTNDVIWFNPDFNIPASTNSVNSVTVVLWGTPGTTNSQLNGNNIGIAPYLTGTYGADDNGANVFIKYQAWGYSPSFSSNLPTGWAPVHGAGTILKQSLVNTLILSGTSGGTNGIYFSAQNSLPFSYNTEGNTVDTIANFTGSSTGIYIGMAANPTSPLAAAQYMVISKTAITGCGSTVQLCLDTVTAGSTELGNVLAPNSISISNTFILSMSQQSPTTANVYTDYNVVTAIGTGASNPLELSTGKNPIDFNYIQKSNTVPLALYVTRTRSMPPQDVFPTEVFGPVQTASAGATCTFSTNTASINFGSFNPSLNTAGTINAIAVTNAGNSNSNVLVSGSNWNSGGNQFDVTNTIWAGASYLFFAANYPYSSANAFNQNEISLDGTARDSFITINTISGNSIYFGAAIPSVTQAAGTYTQTENIISSC